MRKAIKFEAGPDDEYIRTWVEFEFSYVSGQLGRYSVDWVEIHGAINTAQKHEYKWDHRNRLIQHDLFQIGGEGAGVAYTLPISNSSPAGLTIDHASTINYTYDAFGGLIGKQYDDHSTSNTDFEERYIEEGGRRVYSETVFAGNAGVGDKRIISLPHPNANYILAEENLTPDTGNGDVEQFHCLGHCR